MKSSIDRPNIVENKHLDYLDKLQKSGKTNMFGAGPYVEARFGLDRHDAKEIVVYWMNSYEERHP